MRKRDTSGFTNLVRKGFKAPNGFIYILIGFIFTAVFVTQNYYLAKTASEPTSLEVDYEKIPWVGKSVLQPNPSTIQISKQSRNSTKFYYELNKINRIRIRNLSSYAAQRVNVKLIINEKSPFVFTNVTLSGDYNLDWKIAQKDEVKYKFVELRIDTIPGGDKPCEILFVYAYSKSIISHKIVEKNAFQIKVTWEGQKIKPEYKTYDLEY